MKKEVTPFDILKSNAETIKENMRAINSQTSILVENLQLYSSSFFLIILLSLNDGDERPYQTLNEYICKTSKELSDIGYPNSARRFSAMIRSAVGFYAGIFCEANNKKKGGAK